MNNHIGLLRYLWALGLALAMTGIWASTFTGPDEDEIILTVDGRVQGAGPLLFRLQDLQALPKHELITSTVVTDGVFRFQGVLMRDLLDSVSAQGSVIEAAATNGYSIAIPWADVREFNVLVAWAQDGVLLDPKDKGPLWIVYPRDDFRELRDIRYDYRWVWQLNRLTVK